jgi:hypothetical protein
MLVALTIGAGTASAAAPRIVIFSGGPLAHQVVVSDWQKIFQVTQTVANAPAVSRGRLERRPSLRVSMFWGPAWNDFLAQGHDPATLHPSQADQVGRFYPAYDGKRALIDLPWAGRWPRLFPPRALWILKRLGVPISL